MLPNHTTPRSAVDNTAPVPQTMPLRLTGMPTADEIFDRPVPAAPWLPSTSVVSIALTILPLVNDDLVADLITELLMTVVDKSEELDALRSEISVLLHRLHEADREKAHLIGWLRVARGVEGGTE